ncbi:MAG: D-amino acid aminotransferase [Mariprofundaceae bacterium]|nr:D-amino acid aminotransferase [Mariprofundaceae bacterium]
MSRPENPREKLTAYVNSDFVALEDATVHIEDRGFQFADGVYEVVACIHGNFLDLGPHLDRLQRSCAAIDVAMPCSRTQLEKLIGETWQRNPFDDAMIYIQITRGTAPRAHLAPDTLTPTLIITSRELPKPSEEKLASGASGITLEDFRWKRCDIKSIALLASIMGKQEAHRQDADEAFWVDTDGHVLEGSSTNILAVINDKLVTHPLDHQVLGGITRSMTLDIARKAGIAVEERAWKLNEAGLSECMLTSTTNAILPVCSMNGKPVGNGAPGPLAGKLRKLMLEAVEDLRRA